MSSTLDPDVNVGFLIHDVSRMMRAWFDERLNQSSLAEILELDTVTLGRHIDRLERDDWLERRSDPTDRRAWCLYLTPASRPTLKKMEAVAFDTITVAMRDVDEEERARFMNTLLQIKSNLTAVEVEA